MTTDQKPRVNADMETAQLHLLAAIHDGQAEQTDLLRALLAAQGAPKGGQGAERAAGGRVWVERSLLKAIVDTRPCAVSDPDECSLCELRAALDGSQS